MPSKDLKLRTLKQRYENLMMQQKILYSAIELNFKKFGPEMAYRFQCRHQPTLDYLEEEIDLVLSRISTLEQNM